MPEEIIQQISLETIANGEQVRGRFAEEPLTSSTQNVRECGQQEPIHVLPNDGDSHSLRGGTFRIANAGAEKALLPSALGDSAADAAARNQAIADLEPDLSPIALSIAKHFPGIDACQCALDAVQEWSCAAIASSLSSYDPKRPLLPYATVAVQRTAARLAGQEQKRSHKSDDVLDSFIVDNDPRKSMDQFELRSAIDSAVNQLSSEHQAVIKMRYDSGMTLQEIATGLGTSSATIHRSIKRALAALAALAPYLADFLG